MRDIAISIIGACMITLPLYIISKVRGKSPKRHRAALDRAMSRGHVVTAVLKKRYSSVRDPYSRSANGLVDMGLYEYEYKGKKYRYKLFDDCLPPTLKLYFESKPRKAVEAEALGAVERPWFLIIVGIAAAIYCFGTLGAY